MTADEAEKLARGRRAFACRACDGPTAKAFEKNGVPYGTCRRCGALSRRGPLGDLSSRYSSYLPRSTLSLPEGTRERYREIVRGFAGLEGKRHRRLLDVGAGAGLFLEVAGEDDWEVCGTELSAAAARAAKERGIEVLVGDLDALDLPEGRFDVAVSFETLEHVPDPRAFLGGIRRVLRPGGRLYLTTPNYGALTRRWLGREWLAISADHLCLFTPRSLDRLLRSSGFEAPVVRSRTFLPNEAAKRFLERPAERRGFQPEETAALQRAFAARRSLRIAKAAGNALLGATGLGDVLTALARRPPSGGS